MAGDNETWVRERLEVLAPPAAWEPRAAVPRRRRRPVLRAAIVFIGCLVLLLCGTAVWGQIRRTASPYVFECEQVYTHYGEHPEGRFGGRNWIRIRADGAHEITQSTPWEWAWFINATRVVHPDGTAEGYLGPFPLPFLHMGRNLPPDAWVKKGCAPGQADSVLGHTTLHGREVVMVQMRIFGDRRLTWWRAPSLGCESLKMTEELVLAGGQTKLMAERKTVRMWP